MKNKVCGNCRYADNWTLCHRHPPQRMYVPESESKNGHSISAFPNVDKNDWCGDFKPVPSTVSWKTILTLKEQK